MRTRYRSRRSSVGIGFGVILVLFGLIFVSTLLYVYGTQQTRTFEVTGTDRIVNSNDSYYIVFTNVGEFENTDSVFRGKYDSSSVQNQLQQGGRFTCDTYGWRVPFLSQYPNIVSCHPVS